jgi:uncharacterized membrane protein YedE/YeeE
VIARYDTHARLGLFGFALGATLSATGFTDYGELHRMFTLRDPRLLLAFGAAVVLAGVGFAALCRGGKMPRRPLQPGTIPGALVFGAGWALSGGCPGALLAQLGEGKLPAVVTLGGVMAGVALGGRIRGKLRWDAGSCAS